MDPVAHCVAVESPRRPEAERSRRPGADPGDHGRVCASPRRPGANGSEHGDSAATESPRRPGVDPVDPEHGGAESPGQPEADLVVREHGDQVHPVFFVPSVCVAVESPRPRGHVGRGRTQAVTGGSVRARGGQGRTVMSTAIQPRLRARGGRWPRARGGWRRAQPITSTSARVQRGRRPRARISWGRTQATTSRSARA